jgi:hypothetical protein
MRFPRAGARHLRSRAALGSYARPARRPACGATRCTVDGRERVTPVPHSSIPGSALAGAERWRSVAAASAVVERRQASARRFARAAPAGAVVEYASAGVPPLFLFRGFVRWVERSETHQNNCGGLRRGACHLAALCADPLAANPPCNLQNSGAHTSRERILLSYCSARSGSRCATALGRVT